MTDTDTSKQYRDWGTLNGHDADTVRAFQAAVVAHTTARHADPVAHRVTRTVPRRDYDVVKCSCGFGYSADSSG